MAVDIFIARHGQDQDNANGILNGRRDTPLTEIGQQQAQALAAGIKELGLKFDAILSSPLKRAFKTAQIVGDKLSLNPPVVIAELIERDFGIMSGQPKSQIEPTCAPDIIKTDTIIYFLNPEGAETFPQLIKRANKLLKEIRQQRQEGKVLLVTHGDFGKMIYAAATGKPWKKVLTDFHFGNGELIEITPSDDARLIRLPQHNS